MKITMTNRRKWLLGAGAAVLLTATPSFALFGIGDIVFDPTSYASLVSQLTTLESQYNMLKNNITHFSAKQQWQTTLHALENVNVANMFGETAGMSIALNTNSPSTSSTAWKAATVTMNGSASSYLASQVSRQLPHIAARHDRDCRLCISRLPDGCWSVPRLQKPKQRGQQLTALAAVRRLRQYQQRSPAAQSSERIGGAEVERDAIARHAPCLPRFADDGRQHGTSQRSR